MTNTAADVPGIALYGIANALGILFLPLLAVAALSVQGGFAISSHPDDGVDPGRDLRQGAAVLAIALIVAIVRLRADRRLGAHQDQRIVSSVVSAAGRSDGPNLERVVFDFRDQLRAVVRRRAWSGFSWRPPPTWSGWWCSSPPCASSASRRRTLPWSRILRRVQHRHGRDDPADHPGGPGMPELIFIAMLTAITDGVDQSTVAAGVFLYRVYYWFLPIPAAWIMLKVSRRGRSTLPSAASCGRWPATDSA